MPAVLLVKVGGQKRRWSGKHEVKGNCCEGQTDEKRLKERIMKL